MHTYRYCLVASAKPSAVARAILSVHSRLSHPKPADSRSRMATSDPVDELWRPSPPCAGLLAGVGPSSASVANSAATWPGVDTLPDTGCVHYSKLHSVNIPDLWFTQLVFHVVGSTDAGGQPGPPAGPCEVPVPLRHRSRPLQPCPKRLKNNRFHRQNRSSSLHGFSP